MSSAVRFKGRLIILHEFWFRPYLYDEYYRYFWRWWSLISESVSVLKYHFVHAGYTTINSFASPSITQPSLDKMAAISQTTFLDAFLCMKVYILKGREGWLQTRALNYALYINVNENSFLKHMNGLKATQLFQLYRQSKWHTWYQRLLCEYCHHRY